MNKHAIVEHIWRAIRASLILLAMLLWLISDGFTKLDILILFIAFLAHLTEQFHGYICVKIERVLGWKIDFDTWD